MLHCRVAMRAISLISRYVVRELHDLWGGRACCVAIRSGLFIGLTGQRLPRGEPPRLMCGREHRFATFWQRSLAAYRRPSPTRGHSRRRPQLLTGGCSLRNFRIDLTHGKPVYGETRAGAVPLFPNDPRRVIAEFIARETTAGFVLFAAATAALLATNTSLAPQYNAFLNLPVEMHMGNFGIA